MQKIVLSRKGFDSKSGGEPQPHFPRWESTISPYSGAPALSSIFETVSRSFVRRSVARAAFGVPEQR